MVTSRNVLLHPANNGIFISSSIPLPTNNKVRRFEKKKETSKWNCTCNNITVDMDFSLKPLFGTDFGLQDLDLLVRIVNMRKYYNWFFHLSGIHNKHIFAGDYQHRNLG